MALFGGGKGRPRRNVREEQNLHALRDEFEVYLALKKGYFRNENHMSKGIETCICTAYSRISRRVLEVRCLAFVR
jgi:hypothetical protein